MKHLLQAEALAPFIIAVVLLNMLPMHFAWWVWILIFLAPDLSMLGYLFGNRAGAVVYNLFHHQLIAVTIGVAGFFLQQPYMELAGLVLLGHSALDRAMGYGLKLPQGFNFTHLGMMGKKQQSA